MGNFVKAASATRKLSNEMESLTKVYVEHKKALEANTKELAQINEVDKAATEKAITDRELEVKRELENIRWVKYDNKIYNVKHNSNLNKLDII